MERYRDYKSNDIVQTEDFHLWMLKSGEEKSSTDIEIKTEKKFGLNEERFIACKNCGNRITSSESIISVDGHHTHTFTNPEGFTYEISCFSAAGGCAVDVAPTLENTWFEGFSWSMSICSNCLIHLGWHYERGDESFFGLITDHLVDSAAKE